MQTKINVTLNGQATYFALEDVQMITNNSWAIYNI